MTGDCDMRRFTVYLPAADIGEDGVVVARNLPGADAIRTALELDGAWRVHDREDEYETFRLYHWRPYARDFPYQEGKLDALYATVVKTADAVRDRELGMSMIVDQFLRTSGRYSKAHVKTDEEFDKRLLHVAKRREVHRLDKEIATKLIDALLGTATSSPTRPARSSNAPPTERRSSRSCSTSTGSSSSSKGTTRNPGCG